MIGYVCYTKVYILHSNSKHHDSYTSLYKSIQIHTGYLALTSLIATGRNVLRILSVVHFIVLRRPWGSTVI